MSEDTNQDIDTSHLNFPSAEIGTDQVAATQLQKYKMGSQQFRSSVYLSSRNWNVSLFFFSEKRTIVVSSIFAAVGLHEIVVQN